MTTFIQLHLLTAYPAANLIRQTDRRQLTRCTIAVTDRKPGSS